MRQELKSAASVTYRKVSHLYLRVFEERNALISFLLHGLFTSAEERETAQVDPMGGLTCQDFRELIEYFLDHRYEFVSPKQILEGLDPNRKYALLTFDDGYFNNSLAIPVLKEFNVPAAFFISTSQVQEQKAFWWDVLYRERLKAGATRDAIMAEGRVLKGMTTPDVESYLVSKFGRKAFHTVEDIDRPFTESELRRFAAEPLVHIGNHTRNHAILTNCQTEEMRAEIAGGQQALEAMLGVSPDFISYPNGNYSAEVLRVVKGLGFKLGVTVERRKNYLPQALKDGEALCLGRFMPNASRDLMSQYSWFRSDRVFLSSAKERGFAGVRGRAPATPSGEKIRVLQLIEDFGLVGGAEKLVLDILSNLDRDAFEPHVAIVGPKVLPSLCKSTGAQIHSITSRGRLGIIAIRQLSQIVKQNDIHLIHSHLIKMNTLNGIVSRYCGIPGIGSIHGVLSHETSFRSKLYAKLAGHLVTRTVVVSHSLGRQYIQIYKVSPHKIAPIYNGFDASRIIAPSKERLSEFRRRFDCPEDRKVICAIGNVAKVKGYRFLLEAVASIARRYPEIMLFIAGNDSARDASGSFMDETRSAREELGLNQLVEQLGISKRVVFLGEFHEISPLLAVSSIYVCSSLHEGFSLTTVEAMAAGLPVVVTDCGGPREIVRHEIDGLVVPPAQSEAIAQAAIRILGDPALARSMGEHGKERAFGQFSMRAFIDAHEQLYRLVCVRSSAREELKLDYH